MMKSKSSMRGPIMSVGLGNVLGSGSVIPLSQHNLQSGFQSSGKSINNSQDDMLSNPDTDLLAWGEHTSVGHLDALANGANNSAIGINVSSTGRVDGPTSLITPILAAGVTSQVTPAVSILPDSIGLDVENLVPEAPLGVNRTVNNASVSLGSVTGNASQQQPSPAVIISSGQSSLGTPTSPSIVSANQPSLQGVKVPDENLTPQQRQHREEQLAKIKEMNHMLFPEHMPGECMNVDSEMGPQQQSQQQPPGAGSGGTLSSLPPCKMQSTVGLGANSNNIGTCASGSVSGSGLRCGVNSSGTPQQISANISGSVGQMTPVNGPTGQMINQGQMSACSGLGSAQMRSTTGLMANVIGSPRGINRPMSSGSMGSNITNDGVMSVMGNHMNEIGLHCGPVGMNIPSNMMNIGGSSHQQGMLANMSHMGMPIPPGGAHHGGHPIQQQMNNGGGSGPMNSIGGLNPCMMNQMGPRNIMNSKQSPHLGPGPGNPIHAQLEWSKLQHQFFEDRKADERLDGRHTIHPDSERMFNLGMGPNSSMHGNRQMPAHIRQHQHLHQHMQQQHNIQQSQQGSRAQGPPPPYHQTQRSASVPIATQSPNPSSPNNPTSNLSLPSPRAGGSAINSPAEPGRQQTSFKHIGPGQSPSSIVDSPVGTCSGSGLAATQRTINNNSSNPSTPVSSHLSPNASLKELEIGGSTKNNSGNVE